MNTPMKNRLRLTPRISALIIALAVTLGFAPAAQASVGVGQYPASRPYYCQGLVTTPSWAVHFGNGPTLGYIKMMRSSECQTTWGHFTLTSPSNYQFIVSIWHPNGPSTREWSFYYPGWQDTAMISSNRGEQSCIGAQVYVRNGPYVGWYFGGCFTA